MTRECHVRIYENLGVPLIYSTLTTAAASVLSVIIKASARSRGARSRGRFVCFYGLYLLMMGRGSWRVKTTAPWQRSIHMMPRVTVLQRLTTTALNLTNTTRTLEVLQASTSGETYSRIENQLWNDSIITGRTRKFSIPNKLDINSLFGH